MKFFFILKNVLKPHLNDLVAGDKKWFYYFQPQYLIFENDSDQCYDGQ